MNKLEEKEIDDACDAIKDLASHPIDKLMCEILIKEIKKELSQDSHLFNAVFKKVPTSKKWWEFWKPEFTYKNRL